MLCDVREAKNPATGIRIPLATFSTLWGHQTPQDGPKDPIDGEFDTASKR